MKSKAEIEKILENLPEDGTTKFCGMNYEQGIAEALQWVLEEIPDEDFEYV